jgi:hypothetical protein
MSIKRLINREIKAKQEFLIGRVLSVRELKYGDPTNLTHYVWYADVDVGGNRVLRDVPIKSAGSGTRFYASQDQTVLLKRNAAGRFDIVGPADRQVSQVIVKEYSLADQSQTSQTTLGFSFRKEAFEFYEGPTPGTPGTSLWADGTTPFPKVTIIDAQGNEV